MWSAEELEPRLADPAHTGHVRQGAEGPVILKAILERNPMLALDRCRA
jgi:hypothetical protein